MKQKYILISVLFLIILTKLYAIPVQMEMMNGDEFNAELITNEIMFITDYTELILDTAFISRIVFPRPGYRTTEIRTVFKEEIFGGFILNDSLKLMILGKELKINRDKISAIYFHENAQREPVYNTQLTLRTGDSFYAQFIQGNITIETSYQNLEIPISQIEKIEFEGEGKIITTVTMENSNQFKGVIKDEFLSLETVYNSDLLLVPDKIKEIIFPEEQMTTESKKGNDPLANAPKSKEEVNNEVNNLDIRSYFSLIQLDSNSFRIKIKNPEEFYIAVLLMDYTGRRGKLLFPNQYAKNNYCEMQEEITIPSIYSSLKTSDKSKNLVVYFSKSQFDDYSKWEKLFLLGREINISTGSMEEKLQESTFSDFYKYELYLTELF